MKSILLSAVLLFSSITMANEWFAKKSVVKCGMQILEKQKMNQEVALELVDILKNLTEENADELLAACKSLKKKARKAPYMEMEGIQKFFEYDYDMEYSERITRRALTEFTYGTYDCKTQGVEADVALGIHLGVGVNLGMCQSSTGRRYFIVAPEISVGVGLGAYVLFEKAEFTLRQGETLHMDDDLSIVIGAGYVESRPLKGSSDSNGGGIGIGVSLKAGTTLNLKLIPLGRNYTYLLNNLSQSKVIE